MRITVVFDNYAYDPRLQTAWGYSCVIERSHTTILFDTGGDGDILLSNMETLGFEPRDVDIVVLSHNHSDHTGGLTKLLAAGVHPIVYAPAALSESLKAEIRTHAELIEIHDALEITPGVYSTGEMGSDIVEQALVLDAGRDTVVVTGCAHPGIVAMVRQAEEVSGEPSGLVMGGFHLGAASPDSIQAIIEALRRLGVQQVAPSHCTGDRAMDLFRSAYGPDFVFSGCGRVLDVPLQGEE